MKTFLSLLLLAGSTVSLAASTPRSIPIGLASNFSEPSSSSSNPYGDYFRNGVRLALLDSAARLEAKGLRIDLQEFDYGTAQVRVREAAQRAVASSVIGVLGYNFSSHALLGAPIHQAAKLPMLTPSASADRIGKLGPYVHVGCFDNAFMGTTLARVARKRLHALRAAVVVSADCAYCQDLARTFEDEFQRAGGTIAVRSEALEADTDFAATIVKLKSASFDVVLVPNQELNSARIISAVLKAGIRKPFLGGDGWGNVGDEFFAVLGDQDLEGFSVSHWHPDLDTPRSRRFIHDYTARYGKRPNDTSVLAYDSALLLVEAVLAAKDYTREGLEAALRGIRRFESVTGEFRFHKEGAPTKSLVLLSANRSASRSWGRNHDPL